MQQITNGSVRADLNETAVEEKEPNRRIDRIRQVGEQVRRVAVRKWTTPFRRAIWFRLYPTSFRKGLCAPPGLVSEKLTRRQSFANWVSIFFAGAQLQFPRYGARRRRVLFAKPAPDTLLPLPPFLPSFRVSPRIISLRVSPISASRNASEFWFSVLLSNMGFSYIGQNFAKFGKEWHVSRGDILERWKAMRNLLLKY